MKLPFTVQQFLEVFKNYNLSVFPAQVLLYLLALLIIFLAIKKYPASGVIISTGLGLLWLWMGGVYHLSFFASINQAAMLFGVLFIVQGLLFIYFGVVKRRLLFQFHAGYKAWTGAAFVFYALAVYPLLNYVFGHGYPSSPTFGLPCPTTIFTFGILLWSVHLPNKIIFIIPFLWSLLGFSAAMQLGIREDLGLVVAGLLATGILLLDRENKRLGTKKNRPSSRFA